MKQRLFKLISAAVIPAILLSLCAFAPVMAAGGYPLGVSDPVVGNALNYLRGQQGADGGISDFSSSAWITMAVKAAGEDPSTWTTGSSPSLVDYLAANAGSAASATDYARMLMAIAAADADPADFGGRDFLALLKAEYDGTQIGDNTLANDDIWGILGLLAAGESAGSTEVAGAVAFLTSNQNADGGWGWSVGGASDGDDTSAAIMALIAAGEDASSSVIGDALAYLKTIQLANGGFESWGSTNADTDSWGISGIYSAGQDPTAVAWESTSGNTPVDDLLTFQQGDGSFHWQSGTPGMSVAKTTACAVMALIGEPFPVAVLGSQDEDDISVRVEGESDTVWCGGVTVTESFITATNSGTVYHLDDPTALGALDEASQAGSFSYETSDQYGSPYVTVIAGETAAGMSGWMYRVDAYSPSVGAGDFILGTTTPPDPPHLEVLWFYGEYTDLPLKAEVSNATPGVGDAFTVTVEQYSDTTHDWSPCEGATVHADTDYTTAANGTVSITCDSNSTIEVYAEKDGFIRSNRITVTAGEGSDSDEDGTVTLQADILPAISFSLSASSLDFGLLGPGDISDIQPLTITNDGTWEILVTPAVEDDAAGLYVDGLLMDSANWSIFSAVLARSASSECGVQLQVPTTYTLSGRQDGTLIFWAEESD